MLPFSAINFHIGRQKLLDIINFDIIFNNYTTLYSNTTKTLQKNNLFYLKSNFYSKLYSKQTVKILI